MSSRQPIRLLLMEDDTGQARLVQRTLERAGYRVDHACNGDVGLAMYCADSYDVLAIDYQMPGKNGIEILRLLTLQGDLPPTMIVTGHGDEAVAVEAMKLGAGDYLIKDVDGRYLTLLPTVIERLLAHQRLVEGKRQAEEARQRLESQLRHAQKMEAIGTLAGGIAHEFNNMLTVVMGFTQLAQAEVPEESQAWSYLQRVTTAGNRAKTLVQQILAFSHPGDQGREPLAVAQLVREGLTLVRALLPTTVEIHQHICEDGGNVLANRTQLHQVVLNLCANAEYAMRETGGMLDIRVDAVDVDATFAATHPQLYPGPYVRFSIRDTGHGMTPETVGRIFDPFFTTKDVGEGSGMGLAIVYGIVTNHGGAITVDSTPGAGTTFAVYLPRIDRSADEDTILNKPIPHGKACILFIDDENMVAELGSAMLAPLGYEVIVRTSSLEAVETFRATPERFDLVITDQTMPQMTGEVLARELRSIRPDIPIILCTGFSHVIDAEKAHALGMDAFLTKPLVAQELAAAIQRVMDQRAQQKQ